MSNRAVKKRSAEKQQHSPHKENVNASFNSRSNDLFFSCFLCGQVKARSAEVKRREEELAAREVEVAQREKALKAIELCEECVYRRDEASLKSDADTTADASAEERAEERER